MLSDERILDIARITAYLIYDRKTPAEAVCQIEASIRAALAENAARQVPETARSGGILDTAASQPVGAASPEPVKFDYKSVREYAKEMGLPLDIPDADAPKEQR